MVRPLLAALAFGLATVPPALAHDGFHVDDAYARVLPGTNSGAAFFRIANHQLEDDTLVSAYSRAAAMVELHTHVQGADGTMSMQAKEGGLLIPADDCRMLSRGGDHLMFMGLTDPPADGGTLPVTLVFASGKELTLDIPVDNAREPEPAPMPGPDGGTPCD
jgi:copper(I)-binding protein